MISKLWTAVLSVFGIPADEDAPFYRELAINLVFCVAAIGAFAKITFDRADTAFWICLSVALVALVASKDKRVPIATFAVILLTRLAFAGLVTALKG